MDINKLQISDNLGQKSVERLNKFTVFYFNFGFCSNSASPRSPHSMLFSRSLLQVKYLVFATVSLSPYSLNVNIEWGEGVSSTKNGNRFLAKIVA